MNYYGRDRDIQIKVGIMIIITVLIIFFGYSWLRDWFNVGRYDTFKVKFSNVGNIDTGSPVTVYGVKRGRVERINITKDGVILSLLLEIDFRLPTDTKFIIKDSNLMGSRQVDVLPGNAATFIDEHYIAEGESLSSLSALVPKIDGVISEINSLVSLLSGGEGVTSVILETIESSHSVVSKLERLLENNEQEIDMTIQHFNAVGKHLSELLATNKAAISEVFVNASSTIEQFDTSLSKLDKMIDTLEPFAESISNEEGTVHKLINEEELYNRIISATETIDSLLVDIKRNPRRYFKFSLF